MGKSMFNFGKQGKERARQQKQMDKATKRLIVKQQKADLKAGTPNAGSAIAEPKSAEEGIRSVKRMETSAYPLPN